ncbi:MAG: hypothetical protein RLZZ136_556 [Pseudomonadota bacterium]
MQQDSIPTPRSGHKAVRVAADHSAWIEGYRCDDCGAILIDAGMACRRCGNRQPLKPFRAQPQGKVYSWTVVHRSYPGIAVPFVSAIVDLEDGLSLKGTLRDIDPDTVQAGMPVRLIIDNAGGACDKDGNPYVGFHFIDEGAAA